jgi:hypothetical protein
MHGEQDMVIPGNALAIQVRKMGGFEVFWGVFDVFLGVSGYFRLFLTDFGVF